MAYEKQNFIPGQKLKASQLNHIEDGIVNAVSVTEQTLTEAQKSQARKNLALDDIADGKSAYEYATEAGYEGTEAEFAAKLASESSGIHIGAEAPTDENVDIWIDTDEEVEEPKDGEDGATFTPSVSADGVISWTNNRGLNNPEPVNIRGKDGKSAYQYAKDGGYAGTEAEFAKKLAEEYPQPDWEAAEGEAGHVLNRTHWVESGELLPETTLTANENGAIYFPDGVVFEVGETYGITYNNTPYTCTAVDSRTLDPEVAGIVVLGNPAVLGASDTGEPFAVLYRLGYGAAIVDLNGATSCTVAVSTSGEMVHKLDEKFLPDTVMMKVDRTHWEDADGTVHQLDRKYIPTEWLAQKTAQPNPYFPQAEFTSTPGSYTAVAVGISASTEDIPLDGEYSINFDGVVYPVTVSRYRNISTFGDLNPVQIKYTTGATTWKVYTNDEVATVHTISLNRMEMLPEPMPDDFLPDWNAIEGKAGYIKNRTHWVEGSGDSEIVHKLDNKFIDAEWMATMKDGMTVMFDGYTQETGTIADPPIEEEIVAGVTYSVEWEGVVYTDVAKRAVDIFGSDPMILPDGEEITWDPSCALWGDLSYYTGGEMTMPVSMEGWGGTLFYNNVGLKGVYPVKIYKHEKVPNKLPEEFMPELVSPSGKRFVLSVDDNGNITAKEVIT